MRHLRSILYALVLAPAIWILCGVGFDQDLTGRARDNGGLESLSGVLLLLLAGAAYAILLFSPVSPAGPLLAGLTFLGVGAWARIAPESYAGVWPSNIAKDGFNVSTPGYGLAVLLAVPLITTALSARRWAAYEPPQILLIGTLGRARGAARVAGTPMSSERTSIIPPQGPAFQGPAFQRPGFPGSGFPGPGHQGSGHQGLGHQGSGHQGSSADATQVVRHPQPTVAIPARDDEKTTVVPIGRPEQKTVAVPIERPEDNTTVLSIGHADDKTTAIPIQQPEGTAQPAAGNETTTAVPVDDGDEKTTVMHLDRPTPAASPPAAGGGFAEPAGNSAPAADATEAIGLEDKPTEDVMEDKPTKDVTAVEQPTEAMALADVPTQDVLAAEATAQDSAPADETTHDAEPTGKQTEDAGSTDEPTEAVTADQPTPAAAPDEPTDAIAADQPTEAIAPDEPTDAIAADQPTAAIAADEPTAAVTVDRPAQAVASDEPTAAVSALGVDGDEKTQVLRLPLPAAGSGEPAGELDDDGPTLVTGGPGQGEETQVIRLGTVDAPGDRTQVLTLPLPGEATTGSVPVGERTTQETPQSETTKPMSIIGEERPDFADDPTTRLTLPPDEPGTDPGAATTRPNRDRRAMTVTNLERPADEAADDTNPMAIPAQRQSTDDDATRRL